MSLAMHVDTHLCCFHTSEWPNGSSHYVAYLVVYVGTSFAAFTPMDGQVCSSQYVGCLAVKALTYVMHLAGYEGANLCGASCSV